MMKTGHSLAWMPPLVVQRFTLEVYEPIGNNPTILTRICRWLLVMVPSKMKTSHRLKGGVSPKSWAREPLLLCQNVLLNTPNDTCSSSITSLVAQFICRQSFEFSFTAHACSSSPLWCEYSYSAHVCPGRPTLSLCVVTRDSTCVF